jgi:AcrR family transcriptional regulator
MARVSRAEGVARTRSRLLDAAAAEFAEKGFAGASIDAIAERAGRTKGAVYSNFDNKADLFIALLDRYLERGFAELEVRLATVDNAEDLLENVERSSLIAFKRDRASFLLIWEFRLYALRNPEVGKRLAEHERSARAAIEKQIEVTVNRLGIKPPVSPARLATLLQCLEYGVELFHNLEPEGAAEDALTDAMHIMLEASI